MLLGRAQAAGLLALPLEDDAEDVEPDEPDAAEPDDDFDDDPESEEADEEEDDVPEEPAAGLLLDADPRLSVR
jgi:hypothetical protein